MLNTILGIVGWIGTLLVFAAVAIRMFRPQWDQYAYGAAVAGLVCVGLYTLSQWREIGRSFSRREARFGAMTIVSILAVLAILVGLNYLAIRRDKQWDLTATKSFTLSDQTVKVVNSLKEPVKIRVYDKPSGFPRFRDALTPYELAGRNVSVEYVDADGQPARVKDDNVLSYGTVVIDYQGRKELVSSNGEQEITNALVKVTSGRTLKAYFIEGHGEKSSTGTEPAGYSSALDVLKRDNFAVDKLLLAQTGADVPTDASVIVIAGPTADYLPPEIDAIRKYLRGGGKAFFLLDPVMGGTMHPVPNLEALLKEWGVTMGHDVVLDVSGVGQMLGTDASVPVVTPPYPPHPVTNNFKLLTAYPLTQSVSGDAGANPSETVQTLLQTSDRSWSESDVKSLMAGGNVALDEKSGDRKGPISIGLTLSEDARDAAAPSGPADSAPSKPQTRIVVIGDSDFASNAVVGVQGNLDLFVNINNWLAQQEDLISIHPRAVDDRRIALTADQQRRLAWMSLLLIPGLVLGAGVYTWFQRR